MCTEAFKPMGLQRPGLKKKNQLNMAFKFIYHDMLKEISEYALLIHINILTVLLLC